MIEAKLRDLRNRLRLMTCPGCSVTHGALTHPDKQGGYSFVCIECGTRHHLDEKSLQEFPMLLSAA